MMISYATVDRKEKDAKDNTFVVLKVEKFSVYSETRATMDYADIPTFTANVEIERFNVYPSEIKEGDVFSVMHENEKIVYVLAFEKSETQQRRQYFAALMEE